MFRRERLRPARGARLRRAVHPLILLLALGSADASARAGSELPNGYDAVVLRARVLDRRGRPVPNLRLRFEAALDGFALRPDGQSEPLTVRRTQYAATDARGYAAAPVTRTCFRGEPGRWFRGRVAARVTPGHPGRETLPLSPASLAATLPAPEGLPALTLRVFEEPDLHVAGFPVWLGDDGRLDRVVVVLEGFDLYNLYTATRVMALIQSAGDALRKAGIDLLVVDFKDCHLPPDALAPEATRAIEAAARAAGQPVAVAGLSAGGIVARWALVTAEERGTPLPVHTFLSLDAPNRGANLHPALQAMTQRYGTKRDKQALASPAAQALLTCIPENIAWKRVGLPPTDRFVPSRWTLDASRHRDFFDRLRGLNDRGGYPRRCRLIGVANSSRRTADGARDLLRLWLPWGYGWTLPAGPEDRAAGSLLPPFYVDRFRVRRPLGLAGAYLRAAPTFVAAASALDAADDETPPFDAWYARPDHAPLNAHDVVDPGAAAFVVDRLREAPWICEESICSTRGKR